MNTAPWLALLRKAARSYVAGPELNDALRLARSFAAHGVSASTLCFWDAEGDQPRHVADMYLTAIQSIQQTHLDSYVSIKAPSLRFDPELMAEVSRAACNAGIRLHFDSLGVVTVDRTLKLIEAARSTGAAVGATVPGRWRRSPQDAAKLARMGVRVRVVKGQWPDPAGDVELRSGFLQVVGALAGCAAPVAVATHDAELAAAAIGRLRTAGTPCELELLYGLPGRAVLKVSRELAIPVRYYLPYGHAWLPYALRQARRDPRIVWWLLRDAARWERLPRLSPQN